MQKKRQVSWILDGWLSFFSFFYSILFPLTREQYVENNAIQETITIGMTWHALLPLVLVESFFSYAISKQQKIEENRMCNKCVKKQLGDNHLIKWVCVFVVSKCLSKAMKAIFERIMIYKKKKNTESQELKSRI